MNVGLFSDAYIPARSGVVTSILGLKAGLEQRGHRVLLFTAGAPGYPRREPGLVRFPSLPVNSGLRLRLALVNQRVVNRIVKQAGLQVLHSHTEFSLGWSAKRAARTAGLPLVHTAHTMYEDHRHYLFFGRLLSARQVRAYLKRFLTGVDALVCPSIKAESYFRPFLPSMEMVVIGNSLSAGQFGARPPAPEEREQARRAWRIGPDDRAILSVGRLGREKRVVELMAALAPLLREHPRYRLLFAGCGPDRRQLARTAQEQGVHGRVTFLGYVPWEQMPGLYSAADALVTASLSEVHPMSFIEAALCGLPVVARRDAGLLDLVDEGQSGFLVDSDAEIASRLPELLDDDAGRERFSRHALQVSARFGTSAHAEKVGALYRQIAERRQNGPVSTG